jgi:hypothetical protein
MDWRTLLGKQSMGWVSAPLVSQQRVIVHITPHICMWSLNPRVLKGPLVVQLETDFSASVVIDMVM